MIVRSRPSFFELFAIWRLSIVPKIAPQLAATALLSALITWLSYLHPQSFQRFSVAPFTLLGIALSIFLGFRNNVSYDRWWEGRRQLGALIGEVRSLARITLTLASGDTARRIGAVRRSIGYTYALMAHLRQQPMPAQVAGYTPAWPPQSMPRNVPDALLRALGAEYSAMLADHEFGEPIFQRIDERLSALAAIQVACERIQNTPVPFTYTLLLHRTAYAFCFLLPFGVVGTLGFATPFFCALVSYTFFGLDELASDLEEPFGPRINSLALSAIARTVEISLLEALGETNLPEPLLAVDSLVT